MPPKIPIEFLLPDEAPSKPILMMGLPSSGDWAESMSHILIHNLLCASTGSNKRGSNEYKAKLKDLESLGGKDLLRLTAKYAALTILSEEKILDQKTLEVNMGKIRQLEKVAYQAVIVDDTCFIREPDVTAFVMKQYNAGASVVIVGIEGIFDLSVLNRQFKLNWKMSSYTTRLIQLNSLGKKILGGAFPSNSEHVKAHFVVGGGELFTEHQRPEDYEDEEDYPDGPPPPAPGSPVITSLGETKSVSYFGFSNPLDVSYGAIMLKLCYAKAPQHSSKPSTSNVETNEVAIASDDQRRASLVAQQAQSVPALLVQRDDYTEALHKQFLQLQNELRSKEEQIADHTTESESLNDIEALRNQVLHLKKELRSKDEKITVMEASYRRLSESLHDVEALRNQVLQLQSTISSNNDEKDTDSVES